MYKILRTNHTLIRTDAHRILALPVNEYTLQKSILQFPEETCFVFIRSSYTFWVPERHFIFKPYIIIFQSIQAKSYLNRFNRLGEWFIWLFLGRWEFLDELTLCATLGNTATIKLNTRNQRHSRHGKAKIEPFVESAVEIKTEERKPNNNNYDTIIFHASIY